MRTSLIVLLAIALGCAGDSAPVDGGSANDAGALDANVADTGTTDAGPSESDAARPGDAIRGVVRYEDRPYDDNGFTGELVPTAARHVYVELVREVDDEVVAQAVTDESGAFAFELDAIPSGMHRVRAHALGALGEQRVDVRDRTRANAIYAISSSAREASALVGVELLAAADDVGGAFNVVDAALEAYEFIAPYVSEAAPRLTYLWQSGREFACGSCYSRNTVQLGGQLEDTDEYDDVIIIHEWTHYFVEHYSADDSPGGSHRDRQVEPTLAYGEGVAYFFPAMLRARPEVVDTFLGDTRYIDLETVEIGFESIPEFFSTTTGTAAGNLREEIVTAIMWDAFDPANEEHDTVALGADATMRILREVLPGSRTDVGARGIDLADFLDAITCELAGDAEGPQALADDRAFPFDIESDGTCAGKGLGERLTIHEEEGQLVLHRPGSWPTVEGVLRWRDLGSWSERALTCAAERCTLELPAAAEREVLFESELRGVTSPAPRAATWLGEAAALRRLAGSAVHEGREGLVREFPARDARAPGGRDPLAI